MKANSNLVYNIRSNEWIFSFLKNLWSILTCLASDLYVEKIGLFTHWRRKDLMGFIISWNLLRLCAIVMDERHAF